MDHTEQQGLDSCLGRSVLSLEAATQTGYPGTMHAHAGESGQMAPSWLIVYEYNLRSIQEYLVHLKSLYKVCVYRQTLPVPKIAGQWQVSVKGRQDSDW